MIPAAIFVLVFGTGIFIDRGVYFATMSEAQVPMELTGRVSGFASAIDLLPDAFIYTAIGMVLDHNDAVTGYHIIFTMAAVSACVGSVLAILLYQICKKQKHI